MGSESKLVVARAGEEGDSEGLLNGCGTFFGVMKMFWKWMELAIA